MRYAVSKRIQATLMVGILPTAAISKEGKSRQRVINYNEEILDSQNGRWSICRKCKGEKDRRDQCHDTDCESEHEEADNNNNNIE